jgi:hypothetical protein
MGLRSVLVAVIAVATVAFVIGTAIERNPGESPHAAASEQPRTGEAGHAEGGAESAEHRAAEGAGEPRRNETHSEELKPLGIDIESAPFVALAALASLALALAAWLRPRATGLLALVAVAMVVFAALDVREVFHQADEDRAGLAVLAAFIAVLHFGAAVVAAVMISHARRPEPDAPAAAMRA